MSETLAYCCHHTPQPNKWENSFLLRRSVRTWISDAESGDAEVFSTGCTQLNVVAVVVVNSCLGQHGVVLDLALPTFTKFTIVKSPQASWIDCDKTRSSGVHQEGGSNCLQDRCNRSTTGSGTAESLHHCTIAVPGKFSHDLNRSQTPPLCWETQRAAEKHGQLHSAPGSQHPANSGIISKMISSPTCPLSIHLRTRKQTSEFLHLLHRSQQLRSHKIRNGCTL